MNAPAAIRGTYSDLKFIKSRKVAQITIEIPIEQASSAVAVFGTPDPAEEIWVALARLQPDAASADPDQAVDGKPRRRMSELPLPNQVALTCDREAFQRFLTQRYRVAMSADDASEFVRRHCGVDSRRDIRPGTPAASRWFDLNGAFSAWMSEPDL